MFRKKQIFRNHNGKKIAVVVLYLNETKAKREGEEEKKNKRCEGEAGWRHVVGASVGDVAVRVAGKDTRSAETQDGRGKVCLVVW